MKNSIVLLVTASFALIGCDRQNSSKIDSPVSAKDQIEEAADAQKQALNQQKREIERSADQAQDRVSARAKAEKERLETQADAQQAQLEAQKKQVDAQAAAAKADVKTEVNQVQVRSAGQILDDAAGIANTRGQTSTATDRSLTEKVKESLTIQNSSFASSGVTVLSVNGKVTLRGNVKTQAEKNALEMRAKAVTGVTSVENKLEVKAE